MKQLPLRRGLAAASILGVAMCSVLGALPAQATVAPPGTNVIAAAGSDTTETFMNAYLAGRTTSSDSGTTYNVATYNIPTFGTTGFVVPGDSDCPNGNITYGPNSNSSSGAGSQYTSASATTFGFPNGSGAGRRFLVDERNVTPQASCVDIARSSSINTTAGNGETSAFQYYAFALDAVSWATKSQYAPATLDATQIRGIYNCTFTNWNQVGGSDMPIQRILPNPASGTRGFFLSTFGITTGDLATTSANCPAVVERVGNATSAFIEENTGSQIPRAYRDTGIYPYSAGRWAYQANNLGNPTLDIRSDTRMGGYTTGATTPVKGLPVEYIPGDNAWQLDILSNPGRPATVSEANVGTLSNPSYSATTDYRGVRYLFNVVDSNNPSYLPSRGLIGFNNVAGGTFSPLCDPSPSGAGSTLADFGFARLDTANPLNTNLAGSSCRRFLGA